MIIWDQKEFIARWVGKRIGATFSPGYQAVGFMENGRLLAGCVFHNFRPGDEKGPSSIEVSMAASTPRWCTKKHIEAVFHYVYVEAGCYKFYAVTEATNQSACSFLCRLGFSEEGRLKGHFWSGDGIVYGMHRDDCRWLEERNGQIVSTRRA